MIFSKSAIDARRNRVAKNLNSQLKSDEVVLVFAGEPIQKPGGFDQTYEFIPHPDYFWLTGFRRAGGVTAFSLSSGWVDFICPLSMNETIWESPEPIPAGLDIGTFDTWKQNQKGAKFFSFGKGSSNDLPPAHSQRHLILQELFSQARRVKDEEEVALIKNLSSFAARGYQKISSLIRPGISEREIQIEYEAEVYRAGSQRMPYDTIVGVGTNASILHASPSAKIAKSGEMVLIDAGADQFNYCVDITRMLPVEKTLSSQQNSIYQIVKSAQTACIEMCNPGVEWKDVHLRAASVIAQGLQDLNILKIDAPTAVDSEAVAVFFPHGIGHMVGLQVRDTAGPFNPHPKSYAGARIRVDMQMQENFLMTVEPGLYFIRSLLESDKIRRKFKDQINWQEIENWKSFGGVRIEDDILFSANGPVNLTAVVPKI